MTRGFAHRGGAHGPDNTLDTFLAALALGAPGLETDAWLSRDGEVVLDHDGVAGPRKRAPMAQVHRRNLPAHVPTLAELYDACGTDFDLAIDVKSAAVAAAVLAVAQRYRAADRLWVVAPAPALLAGLAGAHRAVTMRGTVMRSWRRGNALQAARTAGLDAVNARWMWWTRHSVEETHALGLLAFGYDAQHSSSLARSMSVGLDGVFSDHVERMTAALAAAGPGGR
jgi:glycerophosphoryl diester phosphodiesterase